MPDTNTIQALRPNVTKAEAEAAFGPLHFAGLVARVRFGRFRALAGAYIPFQIFRVTIHNGPKIEDRVLGIDAVNGSLDLYGFAAEPNETEWVETRSNLPARLSADELMPSLRTKVQRVLFQTGFFRMRALKMEMVPISIVHVPYWVAFYGAEHDLQMRVMDAVRRQMEGAKVRRTIQEWLNP